jgi:hypothetical protein
VVKGKPWGKKEEKENAKRQAIPSPKFGFV